MKDLRYKFSSIEDILKDILEKEEVYIFGYTLEEDTIHLVYLLKNGDINYSTFINGNWTKAQIGKFDVKSNFYNQIEVLYIDGKLNIFYAYSNYINSNIFTLHHVVYKDTIESRYDIIRYISKKSKTSFSVDYDSIGNIHLLYNTIINNLSYVYYTYYSPHKSSWLRDPVKMSPDDKFNENPFILVDTLDNIHAIWWEENPNTYILKYFRMSSSGKEKFKWLEINSLKIKSSVPKGILKQERDIISLIYGDEIYYTIINSFDYGLSWKYVKDNAISNTKEKEIIADEKIDKQTKSKNKIDTHAKIKISEEDIDNIKIDQIIDNQQELKMLLNNVLEELLFIKSKIVEIDESNQKNSLLKKLFN